MVIRHSPRVVHSIVLVVALQVTGLLPGVAPLAVANAQVSEATEIHACAPSCDANRRLTTAHEPPIAAYIGTRDRLGYAHLPLAADATQRSSITFQNHSGQFALVKVEGPTQRVVEVPDGESRTVGVSPGKYLIKVRYGHDPQRYTYVQGEGFTVDETAQSYSEILITLHRVVGGTYDTAPITEAEFNR